MEPEQVKLVQATWTKIAPIAEAVADVFYAKLFELDGKLRPLFPSDLTEQKKKLMAMLAVVVASLDRLAQIRPAIEALALRHRDYGVQRAHYDTVGRALLDTLKVGLGAEWNEQVEAAWRAANTALAEVMIEAAG